MCKLLTFNSFSVNAVSIKVSRSFPISINVKKNNKKTGEGSGE